MKRQLTTLILIAIVATSAFAQTDNKEQRRQWVKEMQQAKVEFMANELKISQEQKDKFQQLYKAMMAETAKLANETKALEKNVSEKANTTDLEYEKAAEALWEFKGKENAIEMRYYNQFKSVLTKEQLFKFRSAEAKWMKKLMKHRRQRNDKK